MTAEENGQKGVTGYATECGWSEGLTKREHFAAMAMQGMLSDESGGMGQNWDADACAERACRFSDALLRALANSAGGEA